MPVHVSIPVRARVDARALRERPEWVRDAVGKAASRALGRAARVVPRGTVTIHAPTFNWRGPGAAEMLPEARRRTEELIARALRSAVRGAGIAAGRQRGSDAQGRGVPREQADPSRLFRLAGRYEVPSYDEGGQVIPVHVAAGDEDLAAVDVWRVFETAGQGVPPPWLTDLRALEGVIATARSRHSLPSGSDIRHYGLFWRVPDGWQGAFNRPGAAGPATFNFGDVLRFGVVGDRMVGIPIIPPPGPVLGWVERSGASVEEYTDVLVEYLGPSMRESLQRDGRWPSTMAADERESQLEQVVRQECTQLAARDYARGGLRNIMVFRIGGYHTVVPFPPQSTWEGQIALLPVTVVEMRPVADGSSDEPPEGGLEGQRPNAEGEGTSTGQRASGGGQTGVGSGGIGTQGSTRRGQDGSRGRPSVVVGEGDASGGAMYPAPMADSADQFTCASFQGEPPVESLGEDGEVLRTLIERIAAALDTQPCKFAGTFAIRAAALLSVRSAGVSEAAAGEGAAALTTSPGAPDLASGVLRFRPTVSPSLQFMRHLAGVIPLLSGLVSAIQRIYSRSAHDGAFPPEMRGDRISWLLRFLYEFNTRCDRSVGHLFVSTCRVIMLQMLRASRTHIQERLDNFEAYAPVFEAMLGSQLTALDELTRLRDALRDALPENAGVSVHDAATTALGSWRAARRDFQNTLAMLAVESTRGGDPADRLVREGENVVGIRDSRGHVWTEAALGAAIEMRRGMATEIDPLVSQLLELRGEVARFRVDPEGWRVALRALLEEMRSSNQKTMSDCQSSFAFAFRAGKIHESFQGRTIPGTGFALSGIHLQAHEAIGEFALGDGRYASGVHAILSVQQGFEEFTEFFLFTGTILLGALCPPAGIALGIAGAAYHQHQAGVTQRVFRSLIEPEVVIGRAEMEVELFAADLETALSIIPAVGPILRGARGVARVGAGAGVRAGARHAVRRVGTYFARETLDQLKHGLLIAVVREFASDQFVSLAVGRLLGPVMESVLRELEGRPATPSVDSAELAQAPGEGDSDGALGGGPN